MPKPNTTHSLPDAKVDPDPALEKRTRRSFTTEYKLEIIQQAEQCKHGELGALLRRENLYSSQLQQWRRDFADGGVAKLGKSQPGPEPKQSDKDKELARLRKENAKLTRELEISRLSVELQKKVLSMMDEKDSTDA